MIRRLILSLLPVLVAATDGLPADLSGAVVYDIPLSEQARLTVRPGSGLSSEDSLAIAAYRFEGDTAKFLAILVDWFDRPGTYPREVFDSLMFSRNVFPGGSVADYYDEVSYGQLTVTGDVIDWYTAGDYVDFVWWDFEDILYALDPVIDYSQYDGNGDGDVDAVVFIRSGNGEEDSQNPNDIWSFALSYGPGGGPGPFDGVYVSRWNTSPETRPLRDPADPTQFLGPDTLNRIRVFCHELGHSLGLPDLYDYDDKLVHSTYYTPGDNNDHPLVDWCIMGYYGYGHLAIGSAVPSHLCGWSKIELGFVEPIVLLDSQEDLVIYDIETHPDNSLYKIPLTGDGTEYFLLEYRNPQSSGKFDKLDSDFSVYFWPHLAYGGDTLDRGLLITHCDDNVPANDGTPSFPHYAVTVRDAGYDPLRDTAFNPEGHVTDSAQWWYPFETRKGALFSPDVPGQDELGPTTVPSSDGYTGPSGVVVRVDSIVAERLYAFVSIPGSFDNDGDGIFDFVDNCPTVYNPNQLDVDLDSVGDLCDNCPLASNPAQTDGDADSTGDVCDNCQLIYNPDQENSDADTLGDSCDNCPFVYNPDQEDLDLDGVGDSCCCVNRGDVDSDCTFGCVTVADLSYLVDYLFNSGLSPGCPEQADADADCTFGCITVADLSYLVDFLFTSGPVPPACP